MTLGPQSVSKLIPTSVIVALDLFRQILLLSHIGLRLFISVHLVEWFQLVHDLLGLRDGNLLERHQHEYILLDL